MGPPKETRLNTPLPVGEEKGISRLKQVQLKAYNIERLVVTKDSPVVIRHPGRQYLGPGRPSRYSYDIHVGSAKYSICSKLNLIYHCFRCDSRKARASWKRHFESLPRSSYIVRAAGRGAHPVQVEEEAKGQQQIYSAFALFGNCTCLACPLLHIGRQF